MRFCLRHKFQFLVDFILRQSWNMNLEGLRSADAGILVIDADRYFCLFCLLTDCRSDDGDTRRIVDIRRLKQVAVCCRRDDRIIFAVHAEISRGRNLDVIACGKYYPERLDDVAWENDLGGFRAYGPALQARGERGFGYDLFTKYNTTEPILESLYAEELNPEKRAKIAELKKTDPKAASELQNAISYHIDHGYGMDCYAVGPTLGAGVAALMAGDTIIYPYCYRTQEILDNGPLRFTVKLEFNPLVVRGDSNVVETRVISLDAGSYLNKTVVSYTNLKEAMPVTTGLVLREPDGAVVADAANGYITYVDPTTDRSGANGKIFVGAAFPAQVKEAKVVLLSEKEKKDRGGADGHVLAISEYEPGSEYTYYWGSAWDKAAIKTPDAWNKYMTEYAQKLRTPLAVAY